MTESLRGGPSSSDVFFQPKRWRGSRQLGQTAMPNLPHIRRVGCTWGVVPPLVTQHYSDPGVAAVHRLVYRMHFEDALKWCAEMNHQAFANYDKK